MIKAVIFDMDGLMADTEPIHWKAYDTVFRQFGKKFPVEDNRRYFVGTSDIEAASAMVARYGLPVSPDELSRMKDRIHLSLLPSLVPQPGLLELVHTLNDQKFSLAVASGSTREAVDAVLEILEVSNFFQVCCTANDVTHGKPDPEVFLLAAQKLDVLPIDCLVLEDSAKGIEAASRAGMLSIAIPTEETREGDFSKATHMVSGLSEVFDWIVRHNK